MNAQAVGESPIPVIDLEVASRSTAPAHLLAAVKKATEGVGVIQVVNHRVPRHLIGDFNERVARLLALPRAAKAKLAGPAGHPYRGWRQWPDDLGRLERERFDVGQFDGIAHARAAGVPEEYLGLYKHANAWPADDPRLHYTTYRYLDAARGVAERVLRLYARAQGLPAGTFPVDELPHLSLTATGYRAPARDDAEGDEGKLLPPGHAYGSAVAVLTRDGDYDDLQVQRPDGDWVGVPAIPGALLVLSGTLLTRWTNGRLRPARHRVVAGDTVTRRSTTVFYYPALGRALAPLAPFTEPGEETGYEPVTTWDLVKDSAASYLKVPGRPSQLAAWREGRPGVAELAPASAGR